MRAAVQLLQVVALTGTAVAVHWAVARIGRPFIRHLERLAGPMMRSLAGISEVLSGLLYLGFIAAAQPVGDAASEGIAFESLLDTIGLFAVLVFVVQLTRLMTLNHVASALEPWPPQDPAGVAA